VSLVGASQWRLRSRERWDHPVSVIRMWLCQAVVRGGRANRDSSAPSDLASSATSPVQRAEGGTRTEGRCQRGLRSEFSPGLRGGDGPRDEGQRGTPNRSTQIEPVASNAQRTWILVVSPTDPAHIRRTTSRLIPGRRQALSGGDQRLMRDPHRDRRKAPFSRSIRGLRDPLLPVPRSTR
jgi:hypothetical protein